MIEEPIDDTSALSGDWFLHESLFLSSILNTYKIFISEVSTFEGKKWKQWKVESGLILSSHKMKAAVEAAGDGGLPSFSRNAHACGYEKFVSFLKLKCANMMYSSDIYKRKAGSFEEN